MAERPLPRLILASGSPRRRELLAKTGLPFEVRPPDVDERGLPGETPRELVERLALDKASAVATAEPAAAVLGSDTVVVLGEEVLGKPRDPDHALELIGRLVGRTHRVLTGVALVREGGAVSRALSVESVVVMRAAEADELRAYVATGESLDKAGGYALQGEGRRFVERVVGSETNVIGLPLDETAALLREAGFEAEAP